MRDVSAWLVPADDTLVAARATPAFPRPSRGVPCRVLGLGRHGRACGRSATATACSVRTRSSARPRSAIPSRSHASPRKVGCDSSGSRPRWRARSRRCGARRGRSWTRSRRTPRTFLHGDWKLGNLGSRPDGRTVLVDWSLPGSGPPAAELAHYLALNVARFPDRPFEGRCDRGIPRVARTPRRRDRAVVGPAARALPPRRHAATRLGEVVRRAPATSSPGGPARVDAGVRELRIGG